MPAEKHEDLVAAATKIYDMDEEDAIWEHCRALRDYIKRQSIANRNARKLKQTQAKITALEEAIDEKDRMIAEIGNAIAEIDDAIAEKDNELAVALVEIERLKEQRETKTNDYEQGAEAD